MGSAPPKFAHRSAAAFARFRSRQEQRSPPARKLPPSIPAPSKSGKPCAPSTLSANSMIFRRSASMSAMSPKSPIASASKPSSPIEPPRPAPQNSWKQKSGSLNLGLSWWFGLLLLLGWLSLLLGLRQRALWLAARLAGRIQIFLRIVLLQDHYANPLGLKPLQVFAFVGWLCVLKVYGIDMVIFCPGGYRYTNESGPEQTPSHGAFMLHDQARLSVARGFGRRRVLLLTLRWHGCRPKGQRYTNRGLHFSSSWVAAAR